MKETVVFFWLACFFTTNAQIVTIPDANFKNALINFEVVDTTGNGIGDSIADTNGDGEIQVSEAEVITGLIVSYYEIVSLEGIENFPNLEVLKSRGNFVETVDISQNTKLEWLHLSTNPLKSLDVSQNVNLRRLWVYNNELTVLDVSQNPNLESLRCYTNNLTQLNIANGNNTVLHNFLAYENPQLKCIQVDDVVFAKGQPNWHKDADTVYSEDCTLGAYDYTFGSILLYPNPATEMLHIQSKTPLTGKIIVVDIQGGVLITQFSNTVRVSHLPAGMYFLQFSSEREKITKQFIKE